MKLPVLLMPLLLQTIACTPRALPGHEGNLLAGRAPYRAHRVIHGARMTDGAVPRDGDAWHTDLSAVYDRSGAEVVFDLGQVRTVVAAYIVADNNDRFTLALSDDDKHYKAVWSVGRVASPGMQPRSNGNLHGSGRYLRLTAWGGDAFISVGELMVFETRPAVFPPEVVKIAGGSPYSQAFVLSAVFFGLMALFAALCERSCGARGKALRWTALLLAAATWIYIGVLQWPPPTPVMRVLRATVALSALLLVVRPFVRRTRVAHGPLLHGLALCAIAALCCFYNFFAPQFEYATAHRKTYVHTWDMRVYYPIAKYFDELGFDGLYFASVAAYRDHGPGLSRAALARVRLRDLRTNLMTTADKVEDAIDAAPSRFSPERYEMFAQDMRFFWESMGGGYLASLRDHGGNATPFWFFLTHWLFKYTQATEPLLLLTAALDPLLLLLFAFVAYRTFGARAALLCLVVYGTTEFPQFDSNWAGSTLRNDWMVAAGLAACALRAGRDRVAGILLSVSGLIRAFPALCAVTACLPLLWIVVHARAQQSPAGRRQALVRLRRLVGAGLVATALGVVAPGLTFGFDASWGRWFDKIGMHTAEPNVNHVGLRTVLSTDLSATPRQLAKHGNPAPWNDWQQRQLQTFHARQPLFYALVAAYLALTIAAAIRSRPEQAALMGLMLVPVLFYPANYYMHCIFLLPLLGEAKPESRSTRPLISIAPVMLLWCAVQYFSYVGTYTDERFYQLSVQLLIAIPLLLLPLSIRRKNRRAEAAATPVVPEHVQPVPF